MIKSSSNKPTHRVYAVTKRGEKSYWNAIGAAWLNKDGKGLSVKLDYLPLVADAEIVIREPLDDTNAQGDAATSYAAAA